MRPLCKRLIALFAIGRRDRELSEEVQAHEARRRPASVHRRPGARYLARRPEDARHVYGVRPLPAHAVAFDPTLLVRTPLLVEPRTLRERVDDSIFIDRMIAALSGFLGVLALLLAAIGIYGVMAYAVTRRTAEIGLRIALGAAPARIEWMLLRDSLRLIAFGSGHWAAVVAGCRPN